MEAESELSEFVTFNELGPDNVFVWNTGRTLMFLDLYKNYRKHVGSLKIRNLKKMFEIIARELELKLKIKVTPGHCENRWKVLERAYKKYVDNNKTTGRARQDFEYAEAMHDILGKKKNINPSLLLSSETHHDIIIKETPKTPLRNEEEIENNEILNTELSQIEVQGGTQKRTVCVKQGKSLSLKNTAGAGSGAGNVGVSSKIYRTKLMKFDILKEIREERKQYYKERLDIEEKKLEQIVKRNTILEERNQLLKESIDKNIQICNAWNDPI